MIINNKLICKEVWISNNLIYKYCEAFEEGTTSNDWTCILDIDLAKLGLNF